VVPLPSQRLPNTGGAWYSDSERFNASRQVAEQLEPSSIVPMPSRSRTRNAWSPLETNWRVVAH
jgi:hypothetical protein